MACIELVGVSKRYRRNGLVALRPTTLTVEAGEFVAVMGPSGAGKSTLIRTINGLETPSAGTVRVGGVELGPRTLRAVRSCVGMVFQAFNLVDRLSVMTNVLTGRLSHRSWIGSVLYLFHEDDLAVAREALERVGLVDRAWERADRLSGGQRQRVGIARALAQGPQVILADEPVASLDPVSAREIMGLLRAINRRDGITIVVNLHQPELIREFADRVIGMNAGEIVFDGPPAALDRAGLHRIYRRAGEPIEPETRDAPALAHA
jgi:phosphonate transport system ATP-binding protein